jgi:hypothetical protein
MAASMKASMKNAVRWILLGLLVASVAAWLGLLALERSYRTEADYNEIEDGLFMGGLVQEPPPGTTAVLNLCEVQDVYECEVHAWQPIRDSGPAPSIDWLQKQVDFVATQRDAGRITYVHCFAGASRSGLVVTAYLMRKHHWTRDEAMAHLRERRPQLRPNPALMELLSEWERKEPRTP